MQNMDVLINLPGIVSGNRSLIIYKIAFVLISTPESLVFTHVQQHNEHIRNMKFIIHMHVQKKTTTNPGKSLFFTWNFVNRLKQTFLQIDLFVACSHSARPNSATIDSFVEN